MALMLGLSVYTVIYGNATHPQFVITVCSNVIMKVIMRKKETVSEFLQIPN